MIFTHVEYISNNPMRDHTFFANLWLWFPYSVVFFYAESFLDTRTLMRFFRGITCLRIF